MEWKQHIAWMAPFLATTVAFLAVYFGERLANDRRLRLLTLVLFMGAFGAAAIAGLFGALITKISPVV
jgi:lipopolysaccharide export LptBFGC system permease protein LptF